MSRTTIILLLSLLSLNALAAKTKLDFADYERFFNNVKSNNCSIMVERVTSHSSKIPRLRVQVCDQLTDECAVILLEEGFLDKKVSIEDMTLSYESRYLESISPEIFGWNILKVELADDKTLDSISIKVDSQRRRLWGKLERKNLTSFSCQ
jgi:hypothetical protein